MNDTVGQVSLVGTVKDSCLSCHEFVPLKTRRAEWLMPVTSVEAQRLPIGKTKVWRRGASSDVVLVA
ncbi:hypothetical protein TNCV_1632791 [Trichonephila clavipes]|nr:hypothetical protein TNCV_1632791 [Trichonephila clavipes]